MRGPSSYTPKENVRKHAYQYGYTHTYTRTCTDDLPKCICNYTRTCANDLPKITRKSLYQYTHSTIGFHLTPKISTIHSVLLSCIDLTHSYYTYYTYQYLDSAPLNTGTPTLQYQNTTHHSLSYVPVALYYSTTYHSRLRIPHRRLPRRYIRHNVY
jgi:hypothetical protein